MLPQTNVRCVRQFIPTCQVDCVALCRAFDRRIVALAGASVPNGAVVNVVDGAVSELCQWACDMSLFVRVDIQSYVVSTEGLFLVAVCAHAPTSLMIYFIVLPVRGEPYLLIEIPMEYWVVWWFRRLRSSPDRCA